MGQRIMQHSVQGCRTCLQHMAPCRAPRHGGGAAAEPVEKTRAGEAGAPEQR